MQKGNTIIAKDLYGGPKSWVTLF